VFRVFLAVLAGMAFMTLVLELTGVIHVSAFLAGLASPS